MTDDKGYRAWQRAVSKEIYDLTNWHPCVIWDGLVRAGRAMAGLPAEALIPAIEKSARPGTLVKFPPLSDHDMRLAVWRWATPLKETTDDQRKDAL